MTAPDEPPPGPGLPARRTDPAVPPENAERDRVFGSPLAQAQAADRPLPFVQALRWLREDASRSFQQIANTAHGKLPKSTAHYMAKIAEHPELTRLPARAELVELFVRGCGRPEAEVRAWVAEWQRIKQDMKLAKETTVRLRPVAASPPEPPAPISRDAPEAPDPVPARRPTGRHRQQPEGTWLRRLRDWLSFPALMPAVMAVLAVVMMIAGDGTIAGMRGVDDRSALLLSIIPAALVYSVLSRQIGNAHRIARAKAAAVLADHRPSRT
ncbi:hypothetical protein JOF56_007715 [Kibdelosporangium banguiense]|uniref:Uncharacterized protein n=1 Tax=Kibdelosporangium banguiense TaxID=1365924 RepID=A0ABS4TSC9_9PSEU|nr:hypothetical protein [Kibdelosporangium banguiense]MBP2327330.1 hypothetical protein [Kibdelosporangium banguiense]